MNVKESYAHEYFAYLKHRSKLGLIYRKCWLYPKLSKYFNEKLLDIGCGIGDMLAFRQHSVGVDVNPYNVDYCLDRGLDAYLIQDGVINFSNQEFDSVLMDNVLEHIENPSELLLEIKRVLKSDGVLLIGVPGVRGYASDSDHKVFYHEESLTNLAETLGFEIDKFFYMPFFKSDFLSKKLKQYTIYSIWKKR